MSFQWVICPIWIKFSGIVHFSKAADRLRQAAEPGFALGLRRGLYRFGCRSHDQNVRSISHMLKIQLPQASYA